MAIYSRNGYYLSYNTGKKFLSFIMLKVWGIIFSDILAYSAFHGLYF